jgi:hypothetical protein
MYIFNFHHKQAQQQKLIGFMPYNNNANNGCNGKRANLFEENK